jgi:hypothetical protein
VVVREGLLDLQLVIHHKGAVCSRRGVGVENK